MIKGGQMKRLWDLFQIKEREKEVMLQIYKTSAAVS